MKPPITATKVKPELQALRTQLDNIDGQLIKLLTRRFKLTRQVGLLKRHHGLPVVDKNREAAMFVRITGLAQSAGVNPKLARNILRLIIAEVVKIHRAIKQGAQ